MINQKTSGDSRYARTGKDGAFYNQDGVLLATVESFSSNVSFNNASYSVLGNAQELETANTFKVTLTMSQVVVEDDAFIQEIFKAMEEQQMPYWNFQGVIVGRNGSEQRVVYSECVPSGQIDLQNVTTGDVIKRSWNFAVNKPPALQSLLDMD